VVVGVEALDIKNDIQDGKDHEAEGQEIFIALGKPTVLIISPRPVRDGALPYVIFPLVCA
jgi:hypothetical protein